MRFKTSEQNGVNVCANVCINDKRMWVRLDCKGYRDLLYAGATVPGRLCIR